MSQLLHQCMTKGIVGEGAGEVPSLKWATARRGSLNVFSDRLECGDWIVPFEQITECSLSPAFGLLPGYVLRVQTAEKTFQFGLNRNRYWLGDLPFPVRREKQSPLLIGVTWAFRCAALAGLIYLVWSRSR